MNRVDEFDVPVALLIRHPLAVVKSWVEIGFFTWDADNPYHKPLHIAFPEVYDRETPQDRALQAWVCLNSAALTRVELILRFELIRQDREMFARLLRWTGVELNSGQLSQYALHEPACNRHERSRERTGVTWESSWEFHDPELAGRAQVLAGTLGYRIEGGLDDGLCLR
jgi:hypothetical protein